MFMKSIWVYFKDQYDKNTHQIIRITADDTGQTRCFALAQKLCSPSWWHIFLIQTCVVCLTFQVVQITGVSYFIWLACPQTSLCILETPLERTILPFKFESWALNCYIWQTIFMIILNGAEIILDMFIFNDRNSRNQEIVVASPFEARSIVLSISANAEIIKHPIFNLIQSYTSIC